MKYFIFLFVIQAIIISVMIIIFNRPFWSSSFVAFFVNCAMTFGMCLQTLIERLFNKT